MLKHFSKLGTCSASAKALWLGAMPLAPGMSPDGLGASAVRLGWAALPALSPVE